MAVIASGTPHDPEENCFPPALTTAFSSSGSLVGHEEPIAVDVRLFDRRQVVLRVVSGVLGVAYGDLSNREQARRFRRILWAGGSAAILSIVLTIAFAVSVIKHQEARQSLADSHVERGLSAVADARLGDARDWFASALAVKDSGLARSGLVRVMSAPLKSELVWTVDEASRPELTSVTFRNETEVAVGSRDGTVRLFDLETRSVEWETALGSEVNAVAADPEADRLIAGLEDGRLVWLDASTGEAGVTTELSDPVLSLRVHRPTGRLAVGLSDAGGVVVLDRAGGTVFELQHQHAGSVQGTSFTRDGEFIYLGGSGSYVWICRLSGGCQRVTRVEDWVYAIDGTPDDRFTAFAAAENLVLADNAMQWRGTLADLPGHGFSLRFDPHGRYLATAGSDRTLRLFDVHSRRLLMSAAPHDGEIYAVEFSPSGQRLASVGLDGRLALWTVDVRGVAVPPHGFRPTPAMLAAPQRNRISEIRVVREGAALVRTWDAEDRILELDPDAGPGASLDEAEFSRRLAMSLDLARTSAFRLGEFSPVGLWLDAPDGQQANRAVAQRAAEADDVMVVMNRDRSLLATIDPDGSVRILTRDGAEPVSFAAESGVAAAAFLSPAGLLVLGLQSGEIRALDARSGRTAFSSRCGSGRLRYLVEDRSRRRILAIPATGGMCWIAEDGRVLARDPSAETETVALSPDEELLATAGLTGRITLWSMERLSEIARFEGHRGPVHALHFSWDGRRLLSGGQDELLRVWDAREAARIVTASIAELRAGYPAPAPGKDGFRAGWIDAVLEAVLE